MMRCIIVALGARYKVTVLAEIERNMVPSWCQNSMTHHDP
jgi:hypothetical protein